MPVFSFFFTVFNDEKSVFYAGFGISTLENPGIRSLLTYVSLKIEKRSKTVKKPVFTVANSTVLTGFEQQNLKKHDARKHSKVKGTHDPTKIRFFFIFFKICKKNQSQKSCKKNQFGTDFFNVQI